MPQARAKAIPACAEGCKCPASTGQNSTAYTKISQKKKRAGFRFPPSQMLSSSMLSHLNLRARLWPSSRLTCCRVARACNPYQERINVYFNEATGGRYVPRAVLMDLEPGDRVKALQVLRSRKVKTFTAQSRQFAQVFSVK